MSDKSLNFYLNLSLAQLTEKIKEIKGELPEEKRNIITYSKNFTLSLSNYCRNQCGYCFYNYKVPKVSGEGNVVILGSEKMKEIIRSGMEYDCKEALLMSGEKPDNFPEVAEELERMGCDNFVYFVKDICSYLLDFNILPHTNIGLSTFDELKLLKNYNASMGLMLESTCLDLFKKGGVHEFSPGKLPEYRIEHIKNAGRLKIPFTTGLLLGIGEKMEDRVRDLLLIRELHEQFGHIQEVIIQNFVYKKGIPYHPVKTVSIEDMLKVVGIARLIFQNEISVQVPPNLIEGHEEQFLGMGITDFGGISPFSIDYINPEKDWPQIDYLSTLCEKNGYQLKERLPIYKKYIENPEFCPENIKKTIDNINLDDYN